MEQGFQGTIIRVKRKRNEEPLDALTVLASTTANRPQALASKSKKGRGFKSLSLESSTDEAPGQEAAAASGASEATSAAASSESTSNQGSAAAEDDDGGGTAPLVFRLMDTIGLRDSSTQAARLKRGIRRAHRASRVNKDSASDAGTEKAAAQELAVGAQEKLRESSKAGRSQAKQAIFDKRRSKVPSSIGSSLAEEEEFVDEGAEPSHATPQTHEATDAGTLSSSEQAAAPEVPTISSKVPSGSPFRPVFKPPPKKPSAARKPAASQPTAEGRSGRGSGSGYSASLGLPASASSFHMVDVQVPPKPKKRVLAEPPPADASQPPRIALNGQPMHAIKATESNRAASKSAASPASASASASPSTKMTPAAAAAGVSPSKSIPTRVLNPWESRMDQAIFAAFQSGVDASGVARALDACSGAHSSRVIQVSYIIQRMNIGNNVNLEGCMFVCDPLEPFTFPCAFSYPFYFFQVANLVRPADGTTPLMAAGWCGDELLCARLLKLGADPLVVDAHGATAEQLCLRRGAAQAGGVVKKAAHAAQAARDDAEYVYDVYVLDLLGTAQERWKAQVTASGGGVAVGGENGMSENEDDNSSSSSSSASALKQQQRMAEVALPEPLRVTRRELSALNRLRNSGRNNDPYGGGEYGGDWSDENDDDDDGLAWSDDGANDSHGDESEDSNDEAAEGNDYPDEEDDP